MRVIKVWPLCYKQLLLLLVIHLPFPPPFTIWFRQYACSADNLPAMFFSVFLRILSVWAITSILVWVIMLVAFFCDVRRKNLILLSVFYFVVLLLTPCFHITTKEQPFLYINSSLLSFLHVFLKGSIDHLEFLQLIISIMVLITADVISKITEVPDLL